MSRVVYKIDDTIFILKAIGTKDEKIIMNTLRISISYEEKGSNKDNNFSYSYPFWMSLGQEL